jgi:hypothetical protein
VVAVVRVHEDVRCRLIGMRGVEAA